MEKTNYDWIKVGKFCKYYDVDKTCRTNDVWEIINIKCDDDNVIYDDTIIEIDNGYSYAEVYAQEIIECKDIPTSVLADYLSTIKFINNEYLTTKEKLFNECRNALKALLTKVSEINIEEEDFYISMNHTFTDYVENNRVIRVYLDKYDKINIETDEEYISNINLIALDDLIELTQLLLSKEINL